MIEVPWGFSRRTVPLRDWSAAPHSCTLTNLHTGSPAVILLSSFWWPRNSFRSSMLPFTYNWKKKPSEIFISNICEFESRREGGWVTSVPSTSLNATKMCVIMNHYGSESTVICAIVKQPMKLQRYPQNPRYDLTDTVAMILSHSWPKKKEILLKPCALHSTAMYHTSVFSLIIKGRLGEWELGTRGCLTLSSMYPLCVLMTSLKSCAPCVTSNTMVMSSHGWSCAC